MTAMRRLRLMMLLTNGMLGVVIASCGGGGSTPIPTNAAPTQPVESTSKKTRTIYFRGGETGYKGQAEIPIR
jgi:hypothetical protein